jgi:spectrin beta
MISAIILHLTLCIAMIGRLCCTDGSEFLFLAATEREMEDWVNKISFHAKLPPSLQLLSYDDSHKVS